MATLPSKYPDATRKAAGATEPTVGTADKSEDDQTPAPLLPRNTPATLAASPPPLAADMAVAMATATFSGRTARQTQRFDPAIAAMMPQFATSSRPSPAPLKAHKAPKALKAKAKARAQAQAQSKAKAKAGYPPARATATATKWFNAEAGARSLPPPALSTTASSSSSSSSSKRSSSYQTPISKQQFLVKLKQEAAKTAAGSTLRLPTSTAMPALVPGVRDLKRSRNVSRVGIPLDFVRLATRAPHVGPQHAREAKRNRIGRRPRIILLLCLRRQGYVRSVAGYGVAR